MRKNIQAVLEAFEAGKSRDEKTCSTDGTTIFSYMMPIVTRQPSGRIAIVRYEQGPSRTTKSQIAACEQFLLPADSRIDDPGVAMRFRRCDELKWGPMGFVPVDERENDR